MTLNIDDAAKKHAAELMAKLADKRAAHMSDLVEAFKRAITEAMPKNPWGYGVAGLSTNGLLIVDGAMLDPCTGKFFDLAADVAAARIINEDDGA